MERNLLFSMGSWHGAKQQRAAEAVFCQITQKPTYLAINKHKMLWSFWYNEWISFWVSLFSLVLKYLWQCSGGVISFIHKQVSHLALANTIITLNYQESLQSLLTSAVHLREQKYGPSAPDFMWNWVVFLPLQILLTLLKRNFGEMRQGTALRRAAGNYRDVGLRQRSPCPAPAEDEDGCAFLSPSRPCRLTLQVPLRNLLVFHPNGHLHCLWCLSRQVPLTSLSFWVKWIHSRLQTPVLSLPVKIHT